MAMLTLRCLMPCSPASLGLIHCRIVSSLLPRPFTWVSSRSFQSMMHARVGGLVLLRMAIGWIIPCFS